MVSKEVKAVEGASGDADDFVMFPDHPAFQTKPPGLISFADYTPKGIFLVPGTTLPTDGNQEGTSKNVALDTAKEEDGLFSSPDIEVDAHAIPTINLEVEHSVKRLGKKKGINATVLRLDKEDAWKLGKDGMLGEKAWKEPEGTWKGKSFGPERSPFDRVMRALEQFFNSRSNALVREFHDPIARQFRRATELQTCNAGPHLLGDLDLPAGATISADEESCLFLRDMEGTLKDCWKVIMEEAGQGWNISSAYSSFEIINSFLHYLQQYSILSEPVFTSQLANVCSLSRKYLRAMTSAGMIYEMSVKRDGWIGLAVSTWVKNITEEWNDEGWKKLGVENWEEDAKAHEMEFAAKLELAKEAGSGEVEVDGNKENAKAEEWDGDAASHEFLLAPLSSATASKQMQELLGDTPISSLTVTQRITKTTATIISATIASSTTAAYPCLVDLVQLELEFPSNSGVETNGTMYIDRSPSMITYGVDLDSILDAAVRLQVTASFVQLRETNGSSSFWVMTDLDRIFPESI